MKKMVKKAAGFLLAAALVLSMGAFAAGDAGTQENADRLHALGLFLGLLLFSLCVLRGFFKFGNQFTYLILCV